MKIRCPGSDRARLAEGLSSPKGSRNLLGTEAEKVVSGHQDLSEPGKQVRVEQGAGRQGL